MSRLEVRMTGSLDMTSKTKDTCRSMCGTQKKTTLLNVISSKHRSKFTAIHGQSWRLNSYVLSGMGKKSINQLFYGPLENIWLISRRHHCRWRGCKFRTVLGTQGLWAWRDLFGVTPAVTRGLGFSGLIRRTVPIQSPLTTHKGVWRIYSYQDPHGFIHVY